MENVGGAIGTNIFTNNVNAGSENFVDWVKQNPIRYGIIRNFAFGHIRDDIQKIIKDVNNNSADTYINAGDLIQKIDSLKTNQYIEANTVKQEINLEDEKSLSQTLMNVGVFEQKINFIKREKIFKTIVSSIKLDLSTFFNNSFALIYVKYNDKKNNYDIKNYGYDTEAQLKKSVGNIYWSNYNGTPIDNLEGHTYKQETNKKIYYYKYKLPDYGWKHYVDYSIKNKTERDKKLSSQYFGKEHPYLIFHIKYNTKDHEIDDLMIALNLNLLKLKNKPIKKIMGNKLGNLLLNEDRLMNQTSNNFTKFDYGKIRSIIEITKDKARKPGGALFGFGEKKDLLFDIPEIKEKPEEIPIYKTPEKPNIKTILPITETPTIQLEPKSIENIIRRMSKFKTKTPETPIPPTLKLYPKPKQLNLFNVKYEDEKPLVENIKYKNDEEGKEDKDN